MLNHRLTTSNGMKIEIRERKKNLSLEWEKKGNEQKK